MNKEKIIAFFDALAPEWDRHEKADDELIRKLVANADIRDEVLDVGCGTGVLIPYYLERPITSIDAVDISEGMIARCREKFSDPRISFHVSDILDFQSGKQYDRIMIYNAFPHFPDKAGTVKKLASLLKAGGRLSIAFGMNRHDLDQVHENVMDVSELLPDNATMKEMFAGLKILVFVDEADHYQIVGEKPVA